MARYSESRPPLAGRYEVAIIGGGINGVAIARECARHGVRTLLLEQADFASGTTSRATRIIHGGLRYLEHGEIALVRESLNERARLATEKPHLVRPTEFLLPIGPGSRRSPMEIRLGLWLYRRFGGNFRSLRHGSPFALQALLTKSERWTIFSYDDAQCEFPERLVADWLVEACGLGVDARNYTQVLQIVRSNGAVRGLRVRDLATGQESSIEAARIVNASGPWVDQVCNAADLTRTRTLIGGIRGSHVVLPRFAGAPDAAVYGEAPDGRPIFLVPWNEQVLLGTTEVPDGHDPSTVQPSENEIEYLFTWLRRFFPGVRLTRHDMHYAYAGVRPLPFAPGEAMSQVTRRHIIHDHAAEGARGLLSIVGGKLTTAGSLAREVARGLGFETSEPGRVDFSPASAEGLVEQWVAQLAAESDLASATVRALVCWHGPAAAAIASLAVEDERTRVPLCDGSPHIVAESIHAFRHENAAHLGDVLLRRVPVALSGWWSPEATRAAAYAIGAAMDWNEATIEAEAEGCEVERSRMQFRDSTAMPLRRRA